MPLHALPSDNLTTAQRRAESASIAVAKPGTPPAAAPHSPAVPGPDRKEH